LHQIAHVGVSPHTDPKLFGHEIIFKEFQPMRSRYLKVTDGQTTYGGITALCVASRGKNADTADVIDDTDCQILSTSLFLVRCGYRAVLQLCTQTLPGIYGNRGHLACFRRYLIELELELEQLNIVTILCVCVCLHLGLYMIGTRNFTNYFLLSNFLSLSVVVLRGGCFLVCQFDSVHLNIDR